MAMARWSATSRATSTCPGRNAAGAPEPRKIEPVSRPWCTRGTSAKERSPSRRSPSRIGAVGPAASRSSSTKAAPPGGRRLGVPAEGVGEGRPRGVPSVVAADAGEGVDGPRSRSMRATPPGGQGTSRARCRRAAAAISPVDRADRIARSIARRLSSRSAYPLSASSARFRPVTSRAIFEAPTTPPGRGPGSARSSARRRPAGPSLATADRLEVLDPLAPPDPPQDRRPLVPPVRRDQRARSGGPPSPPAA